ncbi:MAG: hypothetical protein Fur0010_19900 [Bdellovibrio sp.]
MLILVPTPIDEDGLIHPEAFNSIHSAITSQPENTLILVEDMKPARRRWVHWGFDRDYIPHLVAYNEHNRHELKFELISKLKEGKTLFLMSDGGLPAFCDPGQELVDLCHQMGIKVTATPFDNSVILAVALSGFSHQQFRFLGFPPQKSEERVEFFKLIKAIPETCVLMDAPYRLKKIVEELSQHISEREIFFGLDLGTPKELLLRGQVAKIIHKIPSEKREFVIVVAPRL